MVLDATEKKNGDIGNILLYNAKSKEIVIKKRSAIQLTNWP